MGKTNKSNEVQTTSNLNFKKLLATTTLVAAGAMAFAGHAQAQAHDVWNLDQTAGSFSTDTSTANLTNIDVHTMNAVGSGDLDLPEAHTVNINQLDSSSRFVAIDTENDPTNILGRLNSNGALFILDENGVFFGENAVLNVGSIVASTGDILNQAEFMGGGDIQLGAFTDARIVNQGVINVSDAGLAAFVSPFVVNRGIINAKLGKVHLAAGETVTIDLHGDGLYEVAVDGELADALVRNDGEINAEGGVVQMTARAAKDAVDTVVNMQGVVNVSSVTVDGGKIILDGGSKGTTRVAGELNASGANGGEIEVKGERINMVSNAELKADGGQGVDGQGNGGKIVVFADVDAYFRGSYSAQGGALGGNGGFIETSGDTVFFGPNFALDATAANGDGGLWLIDPIDLDVDAILAGLMTAQLDAGTDVTVHADNDLGIDADVIWTGAGSFTGDAGNDLNLNANIQASYAGVDGTEGGIALQAGNNINMGHFATSFLSNQSVTTNGGDIAISGRNVRMGGSSGNHVSVQSSDGDISIEADRNINFVNNNNGAGSFTYVRALNGDVNVNAGMVSSTGRIRLDGGDQANSFVEINAGNNVTLSGGALEMEGGLDASSTATVVGDNVTGAFLGDVTIGDNAMVQARGGALHLSQGGVLTAAAESINNQGFGTIEIDQNAGGSIQNAIDALNHNGATVTSTLNVGAGTYNENVVVDQGNLTISGANRNTTVIQGAGAGNGLTLAADNISMLNFGVNGFQNGIYTNSAINNLFMRNINVANNTNYGITVHNNAVVNGMDLRNVRLTGNGSIGLRLRGSVSNLSMHGGLVSGSNLGIEAVKGNGDGTYLTDVSIRDVTFTNNALKAIYMEKLSDASFEDLDIRTSGTTGGSSAGIDINLKYGDYQNITLDRTKVRDSATGATNNAITVKARNDGSYAGSPATLTGLTIANSDIVTTGGYGIAIGNAVTGASITNNAVSGASATAILAYSGANNATIANNIIDASAVGIAVAGSSKAWVKDNTVTGAVEGVYADAAADIKISGNTITGSTVNGIHVKNTDGTGYAGGQNDVDIWGNTVASVGTATGILVEDSNYATIGADALNPYGSGLTGGNKVSGGNNGIVVKNSDNAQIIFSTVHDVAERGIVLNGSDDALILDNDLDNIGREGILAAYGNDGVTISRNDLNAISHHGIVGVYQDDMTVTDNVVQGTRIHGIYLQNIGGTNLVDGNTINGTDYSGISFVRAQDITVSNNTLGNLAQVGLAENSGTRNAIDSIDSNGVIIIANTIDNTGTDGVGVSGSTNVQVTNNFIGTNSGNIRREGIDVNNSDGTMVVGNVVNDTGYGGIDINGSEGTNIVGNIISNTGRDGIRMFHSNGAIVRGNTVSDANGHGISVLGNSVKTIDDVTIGGTGAGEKNVITNAGITGVLLSRVGGTSTVAGNEITDAFDDGIRVVYTAGLTLSENVIDGAGTQGNFWNSGIELAYADGTVVDQNTITNSYGHGIYMNHSDGVQVTANTIDGVTAAGGVDIDNSLNVLVDSNQIYNVNHQAVYGRNVDGITISNNFMGTDSVGSDKGDNNLNLRGIYINNGANATVTGNVIVDTGNDGIEIHNSAGVTVRGNKIGTFDGVTAFGTDNIGGEGIDVNNSPSTQITGNTVTNTGSNGISINPSPNSLIADNTVSFFGDNAAGIYVLGSDGTRVIGNDVTGGGVDQTGILVENSNNVLVGDDDVTTVTVSSVLLGCYPFVGCIYLPSISVSTDYNGNDVDGVETGIAVLGGSENTVRNNDVTNIGWNGIEAFDTTGSLFIEDNYVRTTGNYGIYAEAFENVEITDNRTRHTDSDGIGADGFNDAGTGFSALIEDNDVENAGGEGIYVGYTDTVNVIDNNVDDVGFAGVFVEYSGDVNIDDNDIENTGVEGIAVSESANATINNNDVDKAGYNAADNGFDNYGDGIAVYKVKGTNGGSGVVSGGFASITNNDVTNTKGDGIVAERSRDVVIDNNDVFNTDGDGVQVVKSNRAQITSNDVDETDGHGIYVEDSRRAFVDDNDINTNVRRANTLGNGIYVVDSNFADVTNNDVDDTEGHGIYVANSDNANIIDNEVTDADKHGIFVNPSDYVTIEGNELHDVSWDGINVDSGSYANIIDNHVGRTGYDGIDVSGNYGVNVNNNYIHDTGDNGIEVSNSFDADIRRNEIHDTDGDGIELTRSRFADIRGNEVFNAGDDGIDVSYSYGVDVNGNDVDGADNNGIEVSNSGNADIKRNTVTGAGLDGINVRGGYSALITGNTVFGTDGGYFRDGDNGADRDGIHVEDNRNVEIHNNTVEGGDYGFFSTGGDGAGRDGIHVVDSYNADVINNTITGGDSFFGLGGGYGAGDDGIYVEGSAFSDIRRNDVDSTGDDGIDVRYSYGVDVVNNNVSDTDDDGIYVRGSSYADVKRNSVSNTGADGIDVERSRYVDVNGNEVNGADGNGIEVSDSFDADVRRNIVYLIGENGIDVDNSFGADIRRNLVGLTGNDGIHVEDSAFVDVNDNFVGLNGGDGIDVEDSFAADVKRNLVGLTGDNGIEVHGSDYADVNGNLVFAAGENGIYVSGSSDVEVLRNTVSGSGENGIAARRNGGTITVANNTVSDSGDDGIDVKYTRGEVFITENTVFDNGDDGIDVESAPHVEITGNTVYGNADDGIDVDDVFSSRTLILTENTVSDNGDNGIEVSNSDRTELVNNVVFNNGSRGLFMEGANNNEIVLSGNSFTDNAIGAEFQSGAIDLRGDTNTFTGGDVALFFSPAPVGLGFADMSLVGNTIGTTTFSGQSTYYIQAENGAFFNPGTPTVINALNATYDGINPASQGGFLTQAQFDQIEAGIFHFTDLNTLGLFFFGATFDIDQEDLFNTFGLFQGPNGGLNVRLTGLPGISQADLLAQISPAAGEEGTAESLAALEPAAGGSDEETNCWDEAVNAASTGATATYSFGSDPEAALNAAAGCGGAL